MSIWIVVADAGHARFFSAQQKKSPLQELKDLIHPDSRLKGSQRESDAPGRVFDSSGQGRHAMAPHSDSHKTEADRFAREVCRELDDALAAGRFEQLYIMAPPAFLGLLRGHLSARVQERIAGEIARDLVSHNAEDIQAHLPEFA
ncbi:MAG: host attachment protein [Gammaproteobacteria bacterium]|nr:host attachment protein [Gammaproteobacteria bacterium]